MKRIKKLVIMLIMLFALQPLVTFADKSEADENLKGVWVTTVLNLDYPIKPTTNIDELKKEAIDILDRSKNMGLNAVFLQVRPSGDAIYPSKYFPWSKYLTGEQGKAPENQFDPLKFWIDEAHKRDIELHAWINPYRITNKSKAEKAYDYDSLAENNIAKKRKDLVVEYKDGNLYFNPGLPEVRKLLVDSVLEITENYDVDGIHFDDYFYPGSDFKDEEAFKEYGKNFNNISDWRRENVNILIRDIFAAIKKSNDDISFGVSPFGIWNNASSNPLGSDTKGNQSYTAHYADSRKWVKEGIIDYIAPQIYWNIGFSVADYAKLVKWWDKVVDGTDVDLYIGHAAYNTNNKDKNNAWYGVSEIQRQLEYNKNFENVNGSIFFRYSHLKNNYGLENLITNIYNGKIQGDTTKNNVITIDTETSIYPLNIARPSKDLNTNYSTYYLNGSSNPNEKLYINGKEITNRSEKGFFGVLVNLKIGKNEFTLQQDNKSVKRIITRKSSFTSSSLPKSPEIIKNSVYPQNTEYWSSKDTVTLSCKAPIGSEVRVNVNNESFIMVPKESKANGNSVSYTSYTYKYTMPQGVAEKNVYSLGKIEYSMSYKGKISQVLSSGELGLIKADAPYYAKIKNDIVNTYNTASTSNGSKYELYKGMLDIVTATNKNYVRLGMSHWVKRGEVEVYLADKKTASNIVDSKHIIQSNQEIIRVQTTLPVITVIDYDKSIFSIKFANTEKSNQPSLPENSIFKSIQSLTEGSNCIYRLELKENETISGYYIEKTSNGMEIYIRKTVKARVRNTLEGIKILIDPGHGGNDGGALGPLGTKYSEKHINLDTALKLEKKLKSLGADVYMTRKTDVNLSLVDRLTISRDIKPDLFISMHANSMADNIDISKINGFSVYYRENFASNISKAFLNDTVNNLKRRNMNMHQRNFYVIRGTWTTSVLFETGFVPNPAEFEWLMNPVEQSLYADNIAQTVLNYFN